MASKTQRLLVVLGLLVSIVFLWFAFSRLNPAAVWDYVKQADPLPILLGAVVYFGAVTVISARWGFLLRSVSRLSLSQLIPLVAIGYMGNNVYPFRSGEVLRVWLAQRNYGIPFARTATTVAVERIFDGIVMLTFIFVSLLLSPITSENIHRVASVAAPLFVIGLAVFFLLAARPEIFRRVVARVSHFLPGKLRAVVLHVSEEVIGGLECLRTPTDLAGAVLCSYLSWMIEASVYWIVTFAFDLHLSYTTMLLVVGVVNLAGLIPASPGQLGVFEFFVSTVLIAAGVPEAPATSFALTVHVVIWLPITLVGFFFLLRQGLNLQAVTGARKVNQPLAVGE